MDAQLNYASLNINQLTNLDGAQGLNVPGARREEGVHATVFRAGDKTVIVTDANTKDTVNVHYNADGSSTVTVNGEKFELTAQETAALDIHTGDGDDIVTVSGDSEGRGGLTLYTGAGNDDVTGGAGAETVYAGAGDDEIDTGRGNDAIYAGAGDDEIRAGHGHDTVHTGTGDDTVRAGSNDNITVGGDISFVGNVTHGANITVERPDFSASGSPAANEPTAAAASGGASAGSVDDMLLESRLETNRAQQEDNQETSRGGPASAAGGRPASTAEGGAGATAGEGAGATEGGGTEGASGTEGAESGGGAGAEGGSFRGASGLASGNWMVQLAVLLAEVQNKFLDIALKAAEVQAANADFADPGNIGGAEGSGGTEGNGGSEPATAQTDDQQNQGGETAPSSAGGDAGKRAAFIEANAIYTAAIQMFTTMSNTTSTSLKSIGEAIAGIARKQ